MSRALHLYPSGTVRPHAARRNPAPLPFSEPTQWQEVQHVLASVDPELEGKDLSVFAIPSEEVEQALFGTATGNKRDIYRRKFRSLGQAKGWRAPFTTDEVSGIVSAVEALSEAEYQALVS